MNRETVLLGLLFLVLGVGATFAVMMIGGGLEVGIVPCYDRYGCVIQDQVCYGYDLEEESLIAVLIFTSAVTSLLALFGFVIFIIGFFMKEASQNE